MDFQEAAHFPTPKPKYNFTQGEMYLIERLEGITPSGFLDGTEALSFDRNIRVLGIASLAVSEINMTAPYESYSVKGIPEEIMPLVTLGSQVYLMAMAAAGYSLIDIGYNDGGLSIQFNRGTQITAAMGPLKELFQMQLQGWKMHVLLRNGGLGTGQARYHYNEGRFISALGQGSAFGWNIV